jgi:hypothetical protein
MALDRYADIFDDDLNAVADRLDTLAHAVTDQKVRTNGGSAVLANGRSMTTAVGLNQ